MSKKSYVFKPYRTYTVYYSYLVRGEWRHGSRASYAQTVDEAIRETHNDNVIPIAAYEGFHVTEVVEEKHLK